MIGENEVIISQDAIKYYESLSDKLEQSENNYANYIAAVIDVVGYKKHIEIAREAISMTPERRKQIINQTDVSV